MISLSSSNFVKKYAVAITCCSLALLSGCFDNNHKKVSSASSSSSASISSAISSSSSSSSSSAPAAGASYIGQWYAPAYGYVLSMSGERDHYSVKTYSLTTQYCLLQDVAADITLADLEHRYVYSNLAGEKLLEDRGEYSPGVEFTKLDKLPDVCKENLQTLKTDANYKFNAKTDFAIFWQTFNELYVNFEVRGVNWNEAYEKAIKSLDDVKDEEELFGFLSDFIAPLGDDHAILLKAPLHEDLLGSLTAALKNNTTEIYSASSRVNLHQKLINEYLQTQEPNQDLTPAQLAAARDYYLANHTKLIDIIFSYALKNSAVQTRAAGNIIWFKTQDNLGYLFIGSMSDYSEDDTTSPFTADADVAIAEAAISEALKDLADTKGIIIDVRFNGGGQDEVALTFVRHFMSKPQVVYSKFAGKGATLTPAKNITLEPHRDAYLKPAAVLVSGDTASAAEAFTLAMASLEQVTIIGEQTAGAFSDVLIKRLTSDIAFGVSNETYLDTQGKNYERIGIAPNIIVPFATLQERKAGYDGGVDKAIAWIKSKP